MTIVNEAGSRMRIAAAGDLTFRHIIEARARILPYLQRTPLLRHPLLDEALGAELYVKHENHHAIGSFKSRGALNAVLAAGDGVEGVIASSSGNHGQGVAYAARMLGKSAVVVVPEWANPQKVAGIRTLGADIEVHGQTSSECNAWARRLAVERDLLLVDDFRDPYVVAGAGTIALEMLLECPDLDLLVIPLGGGALASGCGIAARGINPDIRIVGVQSESCQGTYRSWKAGHPVACPCETTADGLAVDVPEAELVDVLRRVLDDVVLVTEDELLAGVQDAAVLSRSLIEPSAAAGIAGCRRLAERLGSSFAGLRIGLPFTGANIQLPVLAQAVAPQDS